MLFIIASPFPYFAGAVGPAYLVPIALLDSILLYSVLSLIRIATVQNVIRQLRVVPMFMILFLVALIVGTFFNNKPVIQQSYLPVIQQSYLLKALLS